MFQSFEEAIVVVQGNQIRFQNDKFAGLLQRLNIEAGDPLELMLLTENESSDPQKIKLIQVQDMPESRLFQKTFTLDL